MGNPENDFIAIALFDRNGRNIVDGLFAVAAAIDRVVAAIDGVTYKGLTNSKVGQALEGLGRIGEIFAERIEEKTEAAHGNE